MAHINEVTVSFGATVNLGNYENMRIDVQIKADMTHDDLDNGRVNDLLETARQEVAFGLFELAETKLRAVKWREDAQIDDHMERALTIAEFRWMNKLHADMAADLLANVLADAFPVDLPQPEMVTEAVEDDAAADIYDDLDADEEARMEGDAVAEQDENYDAANVAIIAAAANANDPTNHTGDIPF